MSDLIVSVIVLAFVAYVLRGVYQQIGKLTGWREALDHRDHLELRKRTNRDGLGGEG